MGNNNFKWDPTIDQTYFGNYGSQIIQQESFDKNIGHSFTMEAPNEILELKATSLDGAFSWGIKGDSSPEDTIINIQKGALKITAETENPDGVDAYISDYNTVRITVGTQGSLEFSNIALMGADIVSTYWEVQGTFLFQGGFIASRMNVEVLNNGKFFANTGILNVRGNWKISSSPNNKEGYSCFLRAVQLVTDQSILISKNAIVKFSAKEGLTVSREIKVTDQATLIINIDNQGIFYDQSACFELGHGTSHQIVIGSDDGDFPIPFTKQDITTGRYEGIFNFLSNKEDYSDNMGIFVLQNTNGLTAAYIRNGNYVTINGVHAIGGVNFVVNQSPSNRSDHIIKLIK